MKRPFNAREFASGLVMNLAPVPGLYATVWVCQYGMAQLGDVGRWVTFAFVAGFLFTLVVIVPLGYRLHDWASEERR
jgi:ABC-type multidrug transport system permease subunit